MGAGWLGVGRRRVAILSEALLTRARLGFEDVRSMMA